jgi:uncharacterized membrane protein (DUF485 family)
MQQHHHITPREWDALAADPEFTALLRTRRRFAIAATSLFLLFFLGLPIGVIVAPHAMDANVTGGFTFAYAYGLAQFAAAWIVLALYMAAAGRMDKRVEAFVARAHAELAK